MPFEKYITRLRFIDSLINKKATGDTKRLAKKLGLSRSATLEYLKEMKELGFPIKYCKKRKSYYYEEEGKMVDHIFMKEIEAKELKKITGGKSFFQLFSESGNNGLCDYNFTE
jgi:bacteriocin-like protein